MQEYNAIVAMAEEGQIVAQANERYKELDAYHARMVSEARRLHFFYNPPNQDQWPEDLAQRPGKIHITSNVVKPFVDIDARLQGKLPRLTVVPTDLSEAQRARAELAEKMMLNWLEASGWEQWMGRAARIKALYGKVGLKVFWNKVERRPDVHLLEQPFNLRVGWGSSDFRVMDWAMYESSISPLEVMRRWKGLYIHNPGGDAPLQIQKIESSHDDPLNQDSSIPFGADRLGQYPSDYEKKQVLVWDYWYKDEDGKVKNCTILQKSVMADEVKTHSYLADIPYVIIENDHDPGSPEGISTAAPLIDLQIEMNRALSQWQQLIVDNIDPAWQIDADSVPGGIVPKGGQITPAGEGHEIRAIEKPVNTFPVAELVSGLWNQAHRTSGLAEMLFGAPASAQDSGRALAVQIESAINRLEPKRQEFYGGIRELLTFWTIMVERLNPKIGMPDTDEKKGLAAVFKGLRRWKVVAPEITPRDASDHTNNVINQLNAKLISLRTAMDQLGVDSPEDEIKMISEEQASLPLNPGVVQAMAQVGLLLMQLEQQGYSIEQLMAGGEGGGMPSQAGVNADKAQRQQAQPQMTEDQNQPATGAGGVPPVDSTTLVRTTANQDSQTLGQLAFKAGVGGNQ